ncbi:MAG: major capsid protein [Synergistaceae bacterium]|nr:major capsid protein [Synergistaceae bacterium]MBR0204697.1 major capsid protein [Synergistaceae bacterium]
MIDYYEPRMLLGVIKKTKPLRMFFKTRFFSNAITFPVEKVSFELHENKRRLAPYVSPRIGSEAIERDEYSVKTYSTPLLAPSRVITNDTLAQKILGESQWNSGLSPEDRAARIAAQDIIELQDTIWRREEYMCARVKQDGKLILKGRGVNETVNYGFDNIVTLDASDRWTTTFDIMGQLKTIASEMRKDGVNPDMLILGSKAAEMLLKNEPFLKLLDNRRVEIGEIKPAELEDGISYIGRMIVPGCTFDIYTYEEWVPDTTDLDANGEPKLKPMIDPETVIIQSSREKNSMLYGAITFVNRSGEFETHMEEYVPRRWWTENPSQKFVSISSRPLPMPHDLKSWYVLKGVITGAA